MLAEGRGYIAQAWWMSTFPGLAIVFVVLGVNLLGVDSTSGFQFGLGQGNAGTFGWDVSASDTGR